MTGGHYVIVKSFENDIVELVIPSIDKFVVDYFSIESVIDMAKNFGAWRLLIK